MNKFLIRFFDFIFSFIGLIVLLPFSIIIVIAIIINSKGGVFFRQLRVGKDNKEFRVWKFRTMAQGSDKKGLITIGAKDKRVTRVGYFLRKYKLDELPQLLNVFMGEMSLVGPRPEVRKYVNLYTAEQRKVLNVRPGITDYASIEYADENSLLASSKDPDKLYIEEIMPAKINLNMKYIGQMTVGNYFRIIYKTIARIL